uniref:Legume-specific protein n=2 Tax=Aeschynomene TaxID=48134 RepID=S5VL96_9FABA|nr:legume-specific protein [Aeschynomene virginica]AVX32586.1 legume-specific protein [Aeschynomene sp. (353)]
MEGLIPFVYKAIMQYKNGNEGSIGTWISESPSYSYMRLPGDSGRFQTPASCSASTPTSNPASSSSSAQVIVSSGVQSPHQGLTHRRVVA